jgi:2-polyprenyl-6-methoxyphenol hydroxylase-like FAD-dependent oxidoreductase
MNLPATRVLIVGGGIGGMSSAIVLRRLGMHVDVIDIDPQWRVYGAGITITGPTLRAFKMLGIYDAVMAEAYGGNGIRICSVAGEVLRELETPIPVDADVPGSGGIMRPLLHRILSAKTLQSGAEVRLGLSVESLQQSADHVEVAFTDGTSGSYDFVIGADGLFSRTRTLIFPTAPVPEYVGQYIWRVTVPRPPVIDRRHYFLGGPVKVGLNPVSRDEMYMFVLQSAPAKVKLDDSVLVAELKRMLAPYGGPVARVRDSLDEKAHIIARPLEAFLLPSPWYAGRVMLIGDAAHPTTPQLASGAGMAVEDALVLAAEMERGGSVPDAFQAMMARRYERCRMVVVNSLEIGRREREGAPPESQTELVERSLKVLAQPI